ncbi:hypothetical protein DFJ73DRAFT_446579 [Zopfochytrium polystomum]|nr:hypothetical protein DFJ73DRAFT_446579 [Zopfochytrium polystomum]
MTAVDYLTYGFNEFDLHECWKNATKHKDSIINGRRLENASWRKFFQMKFGLSTINPARLNWQKDSDSLWLFGPFHSYVPLPVLQETYRNPEVCDRQGACKDGCTNSRHLKPALKKSRRPEDFLAAQNLDVIRSTTRSFSDPNLASIRSPVLSQDARDDPLPGASPVLPSLPTTVTESSIPLAVERPVPPAWRPRLQYPNRAHAKPDLRAPLETANDQSKHIRFAEQVQQRLILETSEEDSSLSSSLPEKPAPVSTDKLSRKPPSSTPKFGVASDSDSESDSDADTESNDGTEYLEKSNEEEEDEEDLEDTGLARRLRSHQLDHIDGEILRRSSTPLVDEDAYAGAIFINPVRSTSPAPSLVGPTSTVPLPSVFLKDADDDDGFTWRHSYQTQPHRFNSLDDEDANLSQDSGFSSGEGGMRGRKGLGGLNRSYSFDRNLNKHIELSALNGGTFASAAFAASRRSQQDLSSLASTSTRNLTGSIPKWANDARTSAGPPAGVPGPRKAFLTTVGDEEEPALTAPAKPSLWPDVKAESSTLFTDDFTDTNGEATLTSAKLDTTVKDDMDDARSLQSDGEDVEYGLVDRLSDFVTNAVEILRWAAGNLSFSMWIPLVCLGF